MQKHMQNDQINGKSKDISSTAMHWVRKEKLHQQIF